MTTQSADEQRWIDKQGDIWTPGSDGLMHTPETASFPREYVEKKWGPLRPVRDELAGERDTGTLSTPITDALSVQATKALHQLTDDEWHGMSNAGREYATTGVQRTLEAVYPVIRQQVAEQITAKLAARRQQITPGRPGWDYLTEAIDMVNEIGAGQ